MRLVIDQFLQMTLAIARRWQSLFVLQIWMTLASVLLFSTLLAAVLGSLLARDGSPAVGNSALIDFALSPLGLLTLNVMPIAYLVVMYIEHACSLEVFADPKGRVTESILRSLIRLPRLIALAILQTVISLIVAIPILVIGAFVYWLLLSDADINYYLANRPPKFILAIVIGLLLLAIAFVFAAYLITRWFHALPRLLFDQPNPINALLSAWRDTKQWRSTTIAVLLWLTLQLILGSLAPLVLALITSKLFSLVKHDSITSIIAASSIIILHTFMLSVVAAIGQCWFVAGVWTTYKVPLRLELITDTHNALISRSWIRPLFFAFGGGVALIVVGLSAIRHVFDFTHRQHVHIVAHRGGAIGFPENSLSGVKRSIDLGAYAAEIDVQLSKDGIVIVNHDKDLRRVANLPLVITETNSAELLKADIGTNHKPPLAPEYLPTLEQLLKEAQGRVCLSIELKYYGFKPDLAEKVVELLDRHSPSQDTKRFFGFGKRRRCH